MYIRLSGISFSTSKNSTRILEMFKNYCSSILQDTVCGDKKSSLNQLFYNVEENNLKNACRPNVYREIMRRSDLMEVNMGICSRLKLQVCIVVTKSLRKD